MCHDLLADAIRWLGTAPCFEVYGKARPEYSWRRIEIYASSRRNRDSRWPFWRNCCTTWTSQIIAVGWHFAAAVLQEQRADPASRLHPTTVAGGRLAHRQRRAEAKAAAIPSASEVLAHECGHTWQACRLGPIYLPLVGTVTLFREGAHSWNRFENEASELGMFGGLVPGTLSSELLRSVGW